MLDLGVLDPKLSRMSHVKELNHKEHGAAHSCTWWISKDNNLKCLPQVPTKDNNTWYVVIY
jgi:hypothetical protein